ncbi:MAG: acetoin utilization protein AcuC [Deltaproteobacteria bacterium]|nr:acetoin utilization protein AcuC [Deltaproteobacteria bacterium]
MNGRAENFKSVFIYSDELANFEYSPTHPFKPIRAKLTLELCRRYDLMERPWIRLVNPEPLDFAVMKEFHDEGYLKILQALNSGTLDGKHWPDLLSGRKGDFLTVDPEILKYGLGTEDNPIFSGVYDYAALTAGATFLGAKMIASGEVQVAFNPLGGFHHAGRAYAEGFCYVNDVAVAITHLLKEGWRVAFVDIDAHHGNGVQEAFYQENRVLVISFHESGRDLYPWSGFENEIGEGKGRGFTVNVPLPQNTDDEAFVRAFEEIGPPLLDAFAADIVVVELGADTHISDPLTHLSMTNFGYCQVVKKLVGVAPRVLALGGGGYDVYKTARSWTLAWGILNDLEPRDEYVGVVGGMMFGPEIEVGSLHDKTVYMMGNTKERINREVDRVVSYIKQNVFPIHRIK